MPCYPRSVISRKTGHFSVYLYRGRLCQPSKNRINTKVSNFNTLYQNCSPKMARPKGFEPPISGIGIRCVIQLRHGQILARECPALLLYTIFRKKSIRKLFPDFVLFLLLLLKHFEPFTELHQAFVVGGGFLG